MSESPGNHIISDTLITLSLQHQTRFDPVTEKRFNAEVSSVLLYNFPLIELREYALDFLRRCDEYRSQRAKHITIN